MESLEHLEPTIVYGEGREVELVSLNGKTVLVNVRWGVVFFDIDAFRSMGWELTDISPIGVGEIYKFQRTKT
jgi:hypothetical protein